MSELVYNQHYTTPSNTSSGISDFILLADQAAFAENGIKCPEAPFATAKDSITIKEPHEFLEGEGFIRVNLAPDKNKIAFATIGDKGFKKSDITLTAVIPGLYPEVMAFMEHIKNRPLIILAKDSTCSANQWYQLGCDCLGAYANPTGDTGTTAEGQKGYVVEFNVKPDTALLYEPYEGSPGTYVNPISQLKAIA